MTTTDMQAKFHNVSCSQCGRDFGPGNSGFSDCRRHAFRDWLYREGCLLDEPTKDQCIDAQRRAFEAARAAAPSPDREQVGEAPEGCTPADAEMLRAANHSLAAENDRLRRRLRPFAQLASSPLSWAMVEYCIADDPEKQTLQAPQMQRAFNRAADALREDASPSRECADSNPPFSNCSFRICDLPGQCRAEGECHHPKDKQPRECAASAPTLSAAEREAFSNWWQAKLNAGESPFDIALGMHAERCAEVAQPGLTDEQRITDLQAEIDRLNAIINTPQSGDFLRAVSIEAEHQRQRWGSLHDAGKTPADWFWLVGYLGGKALHAHAAGNIQKAEHHVITAAAACENWHLDMFGKTDYGVAGPFNDDEGHAAKEGRDADA